MKQHDYKSTLEGVENAYVRISKDDMGVIDGETMFIPERHKQTILNALRIADKLMQEPTQDMSFAAQDRKSSDAWEGMYKSIFKTMRDQMLKEIEDGNN